MERVPSQLELALTGQMMPKMSVPRAPKPVTLTVLIIALVRVLIRNLGSFKFYLNDKLIGLKE